MATSAKHFQPSAMALQRVMSGCNSQWRATISPGFSLWSALAPLAPAPSPPSLPFDLPCPICMRKGTHKKKKQTPKSPGWEQLIKCGRQPLTSASVLLPLATPTPHAFLFLINRWPLECSSYLLLLFLHRKKRLIFYQEKANRRWSLFFLILLLKILKRF